MQNLFARRPPPPPPLHTLLRRASLSMASHDPIIIAVIPIKDCSISLKGGASSLRLFATKQTFERRTAGNDAVFIPPTCLIPHHDSARHHSEPPPVLNHGSSPHHNAIQTHHVQFTRSGPNGGELTRAKAIQSQSCLPMPSTSCSSHPSPHTHSTRRNTSRARTHTLRHPITQKRCRPRYDTD